MEEPRYKVGQLPGFSPLISHLISMMTYTRQTTLQAVNNLSMAQLDHLHDERSNSIGALLAHIAAVEKFYQVYTFEGRDLNAAETARWGTALELGAAGRAVIKGRPLADYIEDLQVIREKTLIELAARDEAWLLQECMWGKATANHYFLWFHVFEDELSHRGQIRWLRQRLLP